MSEFVVVPAFSSPLHAALQLRVVKLKDHADDKDYLETAAKWNQTTLRWSREDVAWHAKCLAFDAKYGWAPNTSDLSWCLGIAVLRGRYALECERLLALL